MAQELIDKIRAAAQARNVNPDVAVRIAQIESSLNPTAKAKTSSASGLFQIVDDTWNAKGGKPGRQFDPDENIRVGTDLIASNTDFLRRNLGREPSPTEVYSAHFFGPSGAKNFLTADPSTPVASLFSAKVLEANPHLKGKTAEQVRQWMAGKMGEKAPSTPAAPAAPTEPTPSQQMMEGALKSGMSASAGDLGSGYKAALALAFLGDEDKDRGASDEELRARLDQEEEDRFAQELADYKPANPLQDVELTALNPAKAFRPPVRMADGGDVDESMASRMLKQVVPMDSRIFGSTLFGSRDPITERNFNADELAAMQQAIDQSVKRTGQAQKGSVDYVDYPRGEQIGPGFQPVGQTLGRFTYEKQPDGTTVIRDRYDFYNQGRKDNVESYEKMGTAQKAATVSAKMLKNLLTGDFRGVPNELADAYIGREGRDVTIKLPPVKRAGGGESDPTPEEIEAASRAATFNPQIARQGAAARALAAQRDINTLPDPRTYAAVSGFLGTAPDEMGFSVMHPDIQGIKKAGEAGYVAGIGANIAPFVVPAAKAVGKAATALGMRAEKALEAPVTRTLEGGGRSAEMLRALGAQPSFAVKPTQPIFSHTPTAEAPFVGRLDEFVANMSSPVQKDQFLGMLSGRFRDYDIARAQEALADLPGNAKLAPTDLLNRIKSKYDPSGFKTTVLPPSGQGNFYQSMDNIYASKTDPDAGKLGVIHLSERLAPKEANQAARLKELNQSLNFLSGASTMFSDQVKKIRNTLAQATFSPDVPLSENARNAITGFLNKHNAAFSQVDDLEKAADKLFYPVLAPEFRPTMEAMQGAIGREMGLGPYDSKVFDKSRRILMSQYFDEGNQLLMKHGHAPLPKPDFDNLPSSKTLHDFDPQGWENSMNIVKDLKAGALAQVKSLRPESAELSKIVREDLKAVLPYADQHSSLKAPPSPISFSRYSEHVADIPGMGKVEGIYVNELQSDRLDDLRKLGPRGGSSEKDLAQMDKIQTRLYELGNLPPSPKLAEEAQNLSGKLARLQTRLSQGAKGGTFYGVPEPFAGMEGSPQVAQQLMAKNAIIGAIQQGKQFVAFPGKESAQAQLYEKLPRNLKDVVKDLGPGFEIRPITLTDSDGRKIMHTGVVWGPETAARIQKKGVPFKSGGMVERVNANNRAYL